MPSADAAARDDAVALLRLAGLDAQMDRLRQSLAALLEPLERLRSDLDALAELVESDRSPGPTQESGEVLAKRLRRRLSNQGMHAELAEALKREEVDVLAMASDLQRRAVGLAEEREVALARASAPLRERYEAAIQKGQQPALVALHDGRCPGCGETLPDASRRLVEENLLVVPCSGCVRLLYDRGWTERDLMPSTLRPVTRAKQ
jgi:predicted  nucleic acid-binding Zn-ribbon protein